MNMNKIQVLKILNEAIGQSKVVELRYRKKEFIIWSHRHLEPYEVKEETLFDGTRRLYLYAIDIHNIGEERHIKKFIVDNINWAKVTPRKFIPQKW